MARITEELFWELNRIGIALTAERDIERLLQVIVRECMKITGSDGGSLYIRETENGRSVLRFKVAHNASRDVPFRGFSLDLNKQSIAGYVAVTRKPLHIRDVENIPRETGLTYNPAFDFTINYRTVNMLVVPMIDFHGEVVGVLQLINKKRRPERRLGEPNEIPREIVKYGTDEERIILSLTSQAAILVERAQLHEQIRVLPFSFIESLIAALDARDRSSSGHSRRVAALARRLAEAINATDEGALAGAHFSEEELRELFYAALLHDIGKLGIAEHILCKSQRLSGDRLRTIRYKLLCLIRELERQLAEGTAGEAEQQILAQRQNYFDILNGINRKTRLTENDLQWVSYFHALHFRDWDEADMPLLDNHEWEALTNPGGVITRLEQETIALHVDFGYDLLKQIEWPDDLARLPEIARNHHERLDGSGFPQGLRGEQLSLQARILAFVDEYDELLHKPHDLAHADLDAALAYLGELARAGKHDPNIFEVFIRDRIYEPAQQKYID